MEIRTKINQLILLSSISLILCQCNGFNWHHEMNIKDCNKGDISVFENNWFDTKDIVKKNHKNEFYIEGRLK